MKTWKPILEVLEDHVTPSGLWVPPPGDGTPPPDGPFGIPIIRAGKATDKDAEKIQFGALGGPFKLTVTRNFMARRIGSILRREKT